MKISKAQTVMLFFFVSFPVATLLAADDTLQENPALELIHVLGCKGCHKIQDEGGSLAPNLTQIGSRLTAEQIKEFLTAPVSTRRNGFMPSYNSLSQQELQIISDYLYNLR